MMEDTKNLTRLNPQLARFQNQLLQQYDTENSTADKNQIVFVGSSLMEMFPVEKLQTQENLNLPLHIYNRGIRATTTADVLIHFKTLIADLQPAKIFINIGSNDIGFGISEKKTLANYATILTKVQTSLPQSKLYTMKFYPINTVDDFTDPHTGKSGRYSDERTNQLLAQTSEKIGVLAKNYGYGFIDANNGLTDSEGNLRKELSFDGLHLLPKGYEIVFNNLLKYLK